MDQLGSKMEAGVEAVKDKVGDVAGTDVGAKLEALKEKAGGTGLETKITDVTDGAAEDGTGGVFGGKASEIVGGADKAAEEGAGGLLGHASGITNKAEDLKNKAGGLF